MCLPRETIMVFEKSRSGYLAFVHACLKENGQPREPLQHDIDCIMRGAGHNVHRGRRGWIDDVERGYEEPEQAIRDMQMGTIAEINQEVVSPMLDFRCHQKRVFTTGR